MLREDQFGALIKVALYRVIGTVLLDWITKESS